MSPFGKPAGLAALRTQPEACGLTAVCSAALRAASSGSCQTPRRCQEGHGPGRSSQDRRVGASGSENNRERFHIQLFTALLGHPEPEARAGQPPAEHRPPLVEFPQRQVLQATHTQANALSVKRVTMLYVSVMAQS